MNNGNVAHSFVYRDNGKGGNFEATNGTLWSYSSVLAIHKDKWIVVSDNIRNYSSTSRRHYSHLCNAINDWDMVAITYYNEPQDMRFEPKRRINDEIEDAVKSIKQMLIRQSRARTRTYFDAIEARMSNTKKLIAIYGVDKRSGGYRELLKYEDIEALKENYKDMIAGYKKIEDKRRAKEILAQYKRRYDKIQSLTSMTDKEMQNYTKTDIVTKDFVYRKGDEQLCTTQNLCVDYREAKILFSRLVGGKDVIGAKIGYYTIISHNKKEVKIGCHNILLKELERVLVC